MDDSSRYGRLSLIKKTDIESRIKYGFRKYLAVAAAGAMAAGSLAPSVTVHADEVLIEDAGEASEDSAAVSENSENNAPTHRIQLPTQAEEALEPESPAIVLAINALKETGDNTELEQIIWKSSDESIATAAVEISDEKQASVKVYTYAEGTVEISAQTESGRVLESWTFVVIPTEALAEEEVSEEAASGEETGDSVVIEETGETSGAETEEKVEETAGTEETSEAEDKENTEETSENTGEAVEETSAETEDESEAVKSEELTYDAALAKLYDESMSITDGEVLAIAENMSSDFTAIGDDSTDAQNVIGTIKGFEAEKADYFRGSASEDAYNAQVKSELDRQKEYMSQYVTEADLIQEIVPKVSVSSAEITEDSAVVSVEEWTTIGYDNGEGTGASAYGYDYTLTLSKDEETGAWSVEEISDTDRNFEWIMTADEMSNALETEGVAVEQGSEEETLAEIEYAGSVEYMAAGDGSYSADEAVAYADRWWNSANPNYNNYISRGVDCANFVSQCLYAGGMQQTSTWKPGTYAWVNVNGQIAYLKNFGTFMSANSSNVKKGNPVYYDWDSSGDYDHTAICVGTSGGTPIVDAHTSARYHVNYTMGARTVATIQLGSGGSSSSNGWKKVSGNWYYYKNGNAQTGWQKVNGSWYYLNGSGKMLTGWQKVGGKWYYLYSSGKMAYSTYIGSYYVNASGVWK